MITGSGDCVDRKRKRQSSQKLGVENERILFFHVEVISH